MSDGCDADCLRTLGPLLDAELHSLVLFERLLAVPLDFSEVNENIVRSAIRSDKAEALIAVEPLHSSLRHTLQLLSF